PASVLGLDIGGSSSRARLRSGAETRDATGPGANIATLHADLVNERLHALLDELGDARPVACCAGAAGAEEPAARERLRRLIERRLPECRVVVVHDTRLVLAAAGLDAGIALIAGTGSSAYARSADGREARRGGWGWLVGDEGSGVWVTREAVRLVMARSDADADLGALGDRLLAACQTRDPQKLVARLHELHEAAAWAALARVVFETASSDPGSREIVVRAATELARLVMPLRFLAAEGPVVLAGGLLLHQPLLEDAVRRAIAMPCVRLEEPPVEGAVRLAEGLLVR
ncbi:MAG TPA: BadF/BadG/BcrA/BcrD ATPase family protein, partial [Candidatus Dormibacteraeota bacterium]|nr:BadF/BadG/BcrA/BcrD ATPase family protein [Candidatus Dormibacteraeota bacterium]